MSARKQEPSKGKSVAKESVFGGADTSIAAVLANSQARSKIFAEAAHLVGTSSIAAEIPPAWLADLAGSRKRKRPGLELAWLDFKEVPQAGASKKKMQKRYDPRGSFPYEQRSAEGEASLVLVLLATLHWRDSQRGTLYPLMGGQGVRLIARISPDHGDFVLERLSTTHSLPFVPRGDVERMSAAIETSDVEHLLGDESHPRWPVVAGLDPAQYATFEVGLRVDIPESGIMPVPRFLCRLNALRAGPKATARALDAPAYAFEAAVVGGKGKPPTLDGAVRYPLFANLDRHAFRRDPSTSHGHQVLHPARYPGSPDGRPMASPKDLKKFLRLCKLGAIPAPKPGFHALRDPSGRFFVAQSRHVEGGLPNFDENQPVVLKDAAAFDARSDTAAAVNAFIRAAEFFELFKRFGLSTSAHLGFTSLPIAVRYRAGVVPGAGDGRTINAQVRWQPTPMPSSFPSQLEVRLALADLASNEGRVRSASRKGGRRAPLSIAAASRWCWHEFGHVLIAGATGSLELLFAHSVGDGLGAIMSDPGSKLADRPSWRGVTFPWQTLPNRRHDHVAQDGWSWSGTLARPNRQFAGVDKHHETMRGGYCSEQLMSSTLFMIYRCLGGDAQRASGAHDLSRREMARDHAVALVMRTIGTLGYYKAASVTSPEAFCGIMEAADLNLATLHHGTHKRYGGMAHKVARWAFERQGAFAPVGGVPWTHNAPGLPPTKDVYIESRRKTKGGYEPVSLADGSHLADAKAMWVQRTRSGAAQQAKGNTTNYVRVAVDNRGSATASQVTVRVFRVRRSGASLPRWTTATWLEVYEDQPGDGGPRDVPSGARVVFGPFRWTDAKPGLDYALLAVATSADDRAILDPAAGTPCATARCNVEEAVAFDNNLGLLFVTAQ